MRSDKYERIADELGRVPGLTQLRDLARLLDPTQLLHPTELVDSFHLVETSLFPLQVDIMQGGLLASLLQVAGQWEERTGLSGWQAAAFYTVFVPLLTLLGWEALVYFRSPLRQYPGPLLAGMFLGVGCFVMASSSNTDHGNNRLDESLAPLCRTDRQLSPPHQRTPRQIRPRRAHRTEPA